MSGGIRTPSTGGIPSAVLSDSGRASDGVLAEFGEVSGIQSHRDGPSADSLSEFGIPSDFQSAAQSHSGGASDGPPSGDGKRSPGGDLLRAAQAGDREALDRLVRENSGLIWSVARRYGGRGVELDDLYQLGCVGFLKAVQGFDFTYGTCFSTYAVPKIAGEIRRYLRDNAPVKIGRTMREAAYALYRLRERLRQELGREPALSELSAEAGMPPEEIARLELSGEPPESLQQETADGLPLEGLLGTEAPEEAMVERIALREAVEALPEKERMAILLRYFRGLTQEQAARILRVSQVQVSRLERRGLDRLRRTFGV